MAIFMPIVVAAVLPSGARGLDGQARVQSIKPRGRGRYVGTTGMAGAICTAAGRDEAVEACGEEEALEQGMAAW